MSVPQALARFTTIPAFGDVGFSLYTPSAVVCCSVSPFLDCHWGKSSTERAQEMFVREAGLLICPHQIGIHSGLTVAAVESIATNGWQLLWTEGDGPGMGHTTTLRRIDEKQHVAGPDHETLTVTSSFWNTRFHISRLGTKLLGFIQELDRESRPENGYQARRRAVYEALHITVDVEQTVGMFVGTPPWASVVPILTSGLICRLLEQHWEPIEYIRKDYYTFRITFRGPESAPESVQILESAWSAVEKECVSHFERRAAMHLGKASTLS